MAEDIVMRCPACHRSMIVVEYEQVELDFCPHCHGVWFDEGELDLMLESADIGNNPASFPEIFSAPAAETTEKKRRCPICGKNMKKTSIGDSENLILDVCEQGDGLWFDGGEIDHLSMIMGSKAGTGTEQGKVFNFMKEVFKSTAN